MAGVAGGVGGDLFGGSFGDDAAAAGAAFGAHVDDPVGGLDDVEVVLDDEERAAAVDELAEGGEELGDIVEVEAGGGFVEDVEGAAAGFRCGLVGGGTAVGDRTGGGEMRRELDALGFAAGERGGGLAEADVAEADLVEDVELVGDLWGSGEVDQSFLDGHVEDVVDVLVAVLHFEDGVLVAGATVALFAGKFDVGEELHLDGDGAVAFADIAAAAGNVEGEAAGGEVLAAGVGLRGEELADGVEGLDVGDGVGARGAADGGLVDEDDVVEVLGAGEAAIEMCGVGAFVWPRACIRAR